MRPGYIADESFPHLASGSIGNDPAIPTDDVEPPPDPADADEGARAYVPYQPSGTIAVVQSKAAAEGTGNPSVTLDNAPTEGNLLVMWEVARQDNGTIQTPSGWTAHPNGQVLDGGNNKPGALFYKTAGAGESATIAGGLPLTGTPSMRMAVAEFSGNLALDDSSEKQGTTSPAMATTAVTPSSGMSALVVGGFVVEIAFTGSATPGADITEIDDGQTAPNVEPLGWFGYRIVANASGSYVVDATCSQNGVLYGAQALAFTADTSAIWITAPNTIDGDDATFEPVYDISGTDAIWYIALADTYLLQGATARLAFDASGSKTVEFQGAADEDFTSPVVLDSVTQSAAGSYTAEDYAFAWTPTTAYAYYRLVLSAAENVRVHEVDLELAATSGVTDHGALSGLADDDHPQYVTHTEADADYAAIGHTHSAPSLALDDLTDVNAPTPSDNDVLAFDSGTSTWVPAAPGTPSLDYGEDGDISTLDYDDTPSAGVLDEVARADHVHGMPSEGGGGGGAPTDAKYVVAAAHASLSDEIVIPGLGGDPDRVPASPNAKDDEFDTTDTSDPMTGWTTIGTPTALDINSTLLSHLTIAKAAGGLNLTGVAKTIPASYPFTITAHISCNCNDGSSRAAIFVSNGTKYFTFGREGNSGLPTTVIGDIWTNTTSYGGTSIGRTAFPAKYLRMVVASTSSIQCWMSEDGISWVPIGSAVDPSMTLTHMGLLVNPMGSGQTVRLFSDWFRVT